MRVKYQRAPITTEWTVGAKANTGDGIMAAEKLGRRTGHHGGRVVGPDGAAGRRAVVRAVRAQLPRIDHRQHGRQAVHERVDALRRGVPPHVRRPVRPGPRARREHPGLAGVRPAVPRPLHLRGTATGTTHSEEVAGVRRHRQGRHARGAGRQGGSARRRAGGDGRAVQRLRPLGRRRGLPPRRERLRPLLRRPDQQAQPQPRRDQPRAVLRGQDGAGRPRHQGRHPHRRARAARCATTVR